MTQCCPCLTGVLSRQVAPELQLFVSQLPSSSLELPLPLCRLGLGPHSVGLGVELSRLPRDLLFIRDTDPLRLGVPWKLGRDPWRLGNDPWTWSCKLDREPMELGLAGLWRPEKQPLSRGEDWRRSGGSSSWSLYGPEKTGQDAVEEQEPRSCRVEDVLDLGWRRRVAMSIAFLPLLRSVFGDPLCTDSSLRPSFEMDTHKWTMSGSGKQIFFVLWLCPISIVCPSCPVPLTVHPSCGSVTYFHCAGKAHNAILKGLGSDSHLDVN